MKTLLKPFFLFVFTVAAVCFSMPASAQAPQRLASRITTPIDLAQRVTLAGTKTPRAREGSDLGAVEASRPMSGMSLDFSRTPQQEADLQSLISAQQDVHSALYHQWLTPEEFGARFGVSDTDLATVEGWLQREGFTVESVSRGKNHIIFSGTAGLFESAFAAPIHRFTAPDRSVHIAPANDLSIPAALGSAVSFIRNTTSFHPHRHAIKAPVVRRKNEHPNFTSGNNSFYLLTPPDLATMYDVNTAYAAGYTGAGQSIAVVGISYILPSDIATFQTLAGVPSAKAPIFVLVPATGAPVRLAGDESESDLDVEYSSTIAKGAQVYFVYDGNSELSDPFYAIQYAIDEKVGSIITNSYGDCELDETKAGVQAFDAILLQGTAQGQTVLSAAGDDGSVDCIEDYGDSAVITTFAQSVAVGVDYPASSVNVTGMGGTGFTAANYTYPNTTYWNNATGGVDTASTVKSYIPEVVWNDDDPIYGTSAGGGGISLYEARPTWQAVGTLIGGTALPTGTLRLVPDISLFASPNDPGMLVCSSDPDAFYPGQTSSCTDGFADAVTGDYTIFGGTSFDGPIFAGMLAIINQALNSTGQGNINPTLYSLAANATTYPLAFHDIITGTNACNAGAVLCGTGTSTTLYAAGKGYDEASGLGSVDLMNLITAWPRSASSALLSSRTTVVPAAANPALSASDVVTVTVTSTTVVTSGTASLSVDGTVVAAALALTNGVGTYTFSSGFLGTHIITATYSGDTTHAGSNGVGEVSVGATIPSFTLAATSASVAAGSSTTSTASITPVGGYTGLVLLTVTAPTTLTNACYALNNTQVLGTGAVTTSVTVYTNINNCPVGAVTLAKNAPAAEAPKSPWHSVPLPITLAGLCLLFRKRRRDRLFRGAISLAALGMLYIACSGLTGCVAKPAPTPTNQPNFNSATGAYTLTLSGTDSANPTLVTSTTFTLTVQ